MLTHDHKFWRSLSAHLPIIRDSFSDTWQKQVSVSWFKRGSFSPKVSRHTPVVFIPSPSMWSSFFQRMHGTNFRTNCQLLKTIYNQVRSNHFDVARQFIRSLTRERKLLYMPRSIRPSFFHTKASEPDLKWERWSRKTLYSVTIENDL